jgi:hypothetical protein
MVPNVVKKTSSYRERRPDGKAARIIVMAGFVPAIHVLFPAEIVKT